MCSLDDAIDSIEKYIPQDDFEVEAKNVFLDVLKKDGTNAFVRKSKLYHFSSSAIILSKDKKEILLGYHNIYKSYGWFGGHNDGECDFFQVIKKEIEEETGLKDYSLIHNGIASIEILPVNNHLKNGNYVTCHTHLNVSYIFEADNKLPIRIKPDENSAIGWFKIEDLDSVVSEKDMLFIYHKLLKRVGINK